MATSHTHTQTHTQTQTRIFVSHSHVDNDFGMRLIADLRAALGDDAAVWYDASGGLHGGDAWWRNIVAQVSARSVFLVILSPDAMASPWVNDEIDLAWKQKNAPEGKLILPVLYRACQVREDLQTRQLVSFLPPKPYETALAELFAALGVSVSAAPSAATTYTHPAQQTRSTAGEAQPPPDPPAPDPPFPAPPSPTPAFPYLPPAARPSSHPAEAVTETSGRQTAPSGSPASRSPDGTPAPLPLPQVSPDGTPAPLPGIRLRAGGGRRRAQGAQGAQDDTETPNRALNQQEQRRSAPPITARAAPVRDRAVRGRMKKRAGWVAGLAALLVVSALGVLFMTNRNTPQLSLAERTATHAAGTATANATATQGAAAGYFATQAAVRPPYTIQAPGCNTSGLQFIISPVGSSPVSCPANQSAAHLSGNGAGLAVYLKYASLPARYSVSITFANITACTYVIWRVTTLGGSSWSMSLNGPQSSACPFGGSYTYGYDGCTIDLSGEECVPGSTVQGSGSLGTGSHTITVLVDGAKMSLKLDGTSLGTLSEPTPLVLNTYSFQVQGNALHGAQQQAAGMPAADFSNFSIQS